MQANNIASATAAIFIGFSSASFAGSLLVRYILRTQKKEFSWNP